MDEIRKRFQQLQDRGVSIKAALAEMLGTAGFVLIGLLTVVYASTGLSGQPRTVRTRTHTRPSCFSRIPTARALLLLQCRTIPPG